MRKDDDPQFNVGWYLTALVDILGQKGHLRELKGLPGNPQEYDRLKETLDKTVFPVLALRRLFDSFFQAFLEKKDSIVRRSIEHIAPGALSSDVGLVVTHVSDSIVISIPLGSEEDHLTPCRGVIAVLMAISGIWTVALSKGWPLRGGIDVGISTKLPGGEIYGASLERAYSLEHEIAGWPRIAIGDEFLSYLRLIQTQTGGSPRGRIANTIAELCGKMVTEDAQHQPYLDCLGAPAHQFLGSEMPSDTIDALEVFVDAEKRRWLAKGNAELIGRYHLLEQYVQSRLALWHK
ncbi:MAG: hypothetical protein GWP10_07485 [Nitrospiraceae bacterium]|nr:hypothetical protein [Nitrospiraceae bacterium]